MWECGCCVGKRGHEAEFCLCTQDGAGLTVPRCCTSLSSQQQPPSFCLQVHGLKEACAAVRAAGRRVVVATPRILKPDEQRLWLFYLRLNADALLLRRWGIGPKLFCCYCCAGGVWGAVAGSSLFSLDSIRAICRVALPPAAPGCCNTSWSWVVQVRVSQKLRYLANLAWRGLTAPKPGGLQHPCAPRHPHILLCLPASAIWPAGAAVEGSEFPVPQLEGDFSLNAANVLTADLLLNSGLRCGAAQPPAVAGAPGAASSLLGCVWPLGSSASS